MLDVRLLWPFTTALRVVVCVLALWSGACSPSPSTLTTTSVDMQVAVTRNHSGVRATLSCEAIRHSSSSLFLSDQFEAGQLSLTVAVQEGADRTRFPGDALFEARAFLVTESGERQLGAAVLQVLASDADAEEAPSVSATLGPVAGLERPASLRLVLQRLSNEDPADREELETIEVDLPDARWAEGASIWEHLEEEFHPHPVPAGS